MNERVGASSPRKLFGVIEPVGPLTAGRALYLVGIGLAIVVLERSVNWSLQLPGHHGIEVMALLLLARLSCTNPWAATLAASTAAVAAPLAGASHGVLMPLFYVLPGLLLDLGYRLGPGLARRTVLYLPVVAAIAYASKPAVRVIANATTGMPFGSLRSGYVYPVLTHLLFGFLGALLAMIAWQLTVQRRKA